MNSFEQWLCILGFVSFEQKGKSVQTFIKILEESI